MQPVGDVTTTPVVPIVPGGVCIWIAEELMPVIVADIPPMVTVEPGLKFCPARMNNCPPAADPWLKIVLLMTGVGLIVVDTV